MTETLQSDWLSFVLGMAKRKEVELAGVQRIHRNIRWSVDPATFFNTPLTLASTGYTKAKLSALQRNYYNPESVARAFTDLRWRIDHRKYGSGAFDFRGQPKKNTKQDYCIQSCVISYYPHRKATSIQVFWRTAEIIKRFRGDLIFLRDFIFPMFSNILSDAPPFAIDFTFANCTFHPMFGILLVSQMPNWRLEIELIRKENPYIFKDIMHWCWYYLLDDSGTVDKYSSARQVRNIFEKTTNIKRQKYFTRYVQEEIWNNSDLYPKKVQQWASR